MKPPTITILLFTLLCSRQVPARAQTAPLLNAPAEFQRLLDQDEAARKKGDSLTRLSVALQLRTFLNDAGDAVLATAHAYSVVKDSAKVFESLKAYARLGLGSKAITNGEDRKFAWLAKSPGFIAVGRLIMANTTPIHRATEAISFPATNYLPEDIDYDKQTHSFLFTSVLQHAIFRLTQQGSCRKFAASPSGWPMMAIKIDPEKSLVWATEIAMPGFDGWPDSSKGRSAVCSFDLRSGKLKQRYPAPEGAQWGDMTLDQQGDPIVCDGQSGAIFRLQKGDWQRLDKGDFLFPQTATLTPDGKNLFVPDYARGLASMNIETGKVTWIQPNTALNGIDGLYLAGNELLVTQNGVEPERVLQLHLDKEGRGLTGYTFIERASPHLGEPTHGVLVDGDFYFIANSGWNTLDPHGKVKPGTRPVRPILMRYHLAASRSTPSPP